MSEIYWNVLSVCCVGGTGACWGQKSQFIVEIFCEKFSNNHKASTLQMTHSYINTLDCKLPIRDSGKKWHKKLGRPNVVNKRLQHLQLAGCHLPFLVETCVNANADCCCDNESKTNEVILQESKIRHTHMNTLSVGAPQLVGDTVKYLSRLLQRTAEGLGACCDIVKEILCDLNKIYWTNLSKSTCPGCGLALRSAERTMASRWQMKDYNKSALQLKMDRVECIVVADKLLLLARLHMISTEECEQ